MTSLSIEEYTHLTEIERKEKFKEMALLYCDGVGGLISGPIYKGIGTTFVVGIAGALASYILGAITAGYDAQMMELQTIQTKMASVCKGEINQLMLNAKRILIPGANDMCNYYEKQEVSLKYLVNKAARWVVVYLWGIFSAVFYKPIKGATEDLKDKDYRMTQAKEGLWSMMNSLDRAICYVAGMVEKLLQSCGVQNELSEYYPEYRKKLKF